MRGRKIIAISVALIIALCSCSVKEDRSPCPCYLTFDLSGCGNVSDSLTISAFGEMSLFKESISTNDYPTFYEKTVKKGIVTTSVLCGYGKDAEKNGQIISTKGEDALPLWGYSSSINCTGELARDSVVLGRQSARIHLKVESIDGNPYPYQLVAKSDICGLEMQDLSPVKGDYSYSLFLDSEAVCTFRLYRQTPESRATIEVLERGILIETLPLYAWIEATGYDWSDSDLKDIYIGMDYARANVTITIQDWSAEEAIHITI